MSTVRLSGHQAAFNAGEMTDMEGGVYRASQGVETSMSIEVG
jgi:hypothetical protein